MAALPLYMFATRHKEFAGILPERKIPEIARLIERSTQSVTRKLAQLESLGLCKKHGSSYLFTGGETYTASCGKTRMKMVKVEILDRNYLTTLFYATTISEQGRRITYNQKKQHPSKLSGGVQNVSIACSYTSNYIQRSVQTVSKRRKAAKQLGLIDYERQFDLKLEGAENVLNEFKSARSSGNTEKSEMVFEQNGIFRWVNELPAAFSDLLPIKSYSIRCIHLKTRAREFYLKSVA